MKTLVLRFAKEEAGVTAIEYGLIASLIAVVIITAVTLVGTNCERLSGAAYRRRKEVVATHALSP
jgi:pilus assembly protein Flp/PilA